MHGYSVGLKSLIKIIVVRIKNGNIWTNDFGAHAPPPMLVVD
jgi:hypothetical protein